MKKVTQINVYTTSAASDLVADILFEEGSEGVSVYDSSDFAFLLRSDVIWDYVDEGALKQDPVVRVVGFMSQNAPLERLRARLTKIEETCPYETDSP